MRLQVWWVVFVCFSCSRRWKAEKHVFFYLHPLVSFLNKTVNCWFVVLQLCFSSCWPAGTDDVSVLLNLYRGGETMFWATRPAEDGETGRRKKSSLNSLWTKSVVCSCGFLFLFVFISFISFSSSLFSSCFFSSSFISFFFYFFSPFSFSCFVFSFISLPLLHFHLLLFLHLPFSSSSSSSEHHPLQRLSVPQDLMWDQGIRIVAFRLKWRKDGAIKTVNQWDAAAHCDTSY